MTVSIDDLVKASQKGYRVDVVELASKLNLEVFSVDLPDSESGRICREADKTYIEVNQNHPVTRQRFTIAHETSHYIKHDKVLEEKGQLDRKSEYTSTLEVKMEAEADQMAAQILMPKDLVTRYFAEKKWGKLTRFSDDMITEIADEFRVSRAMAVTRLRELGFPVPFLSFA